MLVLLDWPLELPPVDHVQDGDQSDCKTAFELFCSSCSWTSQISAVKSNNSCQWRSPNIRPVPLNIVENFIKHRKSITAIEKENVKSISGFLNIVCYSCNSYCKLIHQRTLYKVLQLGFFSEVSSNMIVDASERCLSEAALKNLWQIVFKLGYFTSMTVCPRS